MNEAGKSFYCFSYFYLYYLWVINPREKITYSSIGNAKKYVIGSYKTSLDLNVVVVYS